MGKNDEGFVSKHDIYEKLWAARDFEISHLWQRSIFLATFITLTFTVYFSALNSFVFNRTDLTVSSQNIEIATISDNENAEASASDVLDNDHVQLIILDVICLFGFSFAVLWICMARGSKYMYERLENGINIVNQGGFGFFDEFMENENTEEFYEILWNDGESNYIPRHGSLPLSDYDFRVYSGRGGLFSSSKINILIGYFLLAAWIILSAVNAVILSPSITNFRGCILDNTEIVVILIYFAVFISLLTNSYIFFLSLIICSIEFVFILFFTQHNPYVIRTEIILIVQIALFFLISRLCLSGHTLKFSDLFLMSIGDENLKQKMDRNQYKFISNLMNNKVENCAAIKNYVSSKFSELQNTNDVDRSLIKDFLSHYNIGSIRRLCSNEYLKTILETTMMHRDSFSVAYCKTWCDEKNHKIFKIEKNRIACFKRLIDIIGVEAIDFSGKDTNTEARIYADNRWDKARYDPDSWKPGTDDKNIHVIQKNINGKTIYMTMGINDDATKLNVKLTVVDKIFAKSKDKKYSSYAFDLLTMTNYNQSHYYANRNLRI